MSIRFENTVTPSPEQWKAAIMGARNPLNSWQKSDSEFEECDHADAYYPCVNVGQNCGKFSIDETSTHMQQQSYHSLCS